MPHPAPQTAANPGGAHPDRIPIATPRAAGWHTIPYL
jgi:hypothetical protein